MITAAVFYSIIVASQSFPLYNLWHLLEIQSCFIKVASGDLEGFNTGKKFLLHRNHIADDIG
jgi:hypothetical protein